MVGFMGKMAKIFIVCFTLMFFCLGSFFSPSSGKEEIGLKFNGQAISAELQGVSLRLILEKLNREKGIWSKGDESVLEEKVSVRVTDLPLLEGLRRILSDFNHVLVFDRDKRLVGLFILGKKDPGRPVTRDVAIGIDKALPSQPLGEASEDPFEDFPDTLPPGSSKAKSKRGTIDEDSSSPEDPNTERSGTGFVKGSLSPENPFDENIPPLPEGPFAPFVESNFPPTENPFEENISPGFEGPFSDPFGELLHP
jgi:hypothetical protein